MKKVPNIKKTQKESPDDDPTGQVKCAIFQSKNEEIGAITKAINETEDIKKKAYLANRLTEEVETLLSCKYFNEKRADCKICHYISKLRKQTANLIIKARQLK